MKEFFNKLRKRPAARLSLLAIVLLASVVLLGPRLVETAKWNSWTIRFMWHALDSTRSRGLPAPIPAGHDHASIWLAREALAGGDAGKALILVESPTLQNDPYALRIRVAAMEQQGNYHDALQILVRIHDYNLLTDLGDTAANANDQADALAAYHAAWKLDSDSGTLPLANFLMNNEMDYDSAENVLRQSLVALPNSIHWPLWSNRLGDALRAQKRWDEAIIAYKNTIARTPDYWAAYIGLGWARYERGDGLQVAISEFQKAINAPKSQGSGQIAIAQMLTREQRFTDADVWFAQALALNPNNPVWFEARGNAARQAGNLAKALAVYQEALARFPDYAPLYYEIAYTYQLNEQPTEAVASIERALVLEVPPNAYYYVRAGSIYEGAGDINQALNAYRQALQIDPQNPTALKGVERLDK